MHGIDIGAAVSAIITGAIIILAIGRVRGVLETKVDILNEEVAKLNGVDVKVVDIRETIVDLKEDGTHIYDRINKLADVKVDKSDCMLQESKLEATLQSVRADVNTLTGHVLALKK